MNGWLQLLKFLLNFLVLNTRVYSKQNNFKGSKLAKTNYRVPVNKGNVEMKIWTVGCRCSITRILVKMLARVVKGPILSNIKMLMT